MQPSRAAIAAVRSWARLALQAENGHAVTAEHPEDLGLDDLLAAVHRHRLAALLSAHSEVIGVPPALADAVQFTCKSENRAIMLQILEVARVTELFDAAGIPWLAVKGLTLALQSAGTITARGAGDLDIFVAPESVEHVLRLLTRHGWTVRGTSPSDPRSWAWRHVLRTYHEMTFDGPTSTIDVHWRLDPTQSGLPDFDSAWRRRTTVRIGDVGVQTLGLGDAFAQSCNHAAKDDWRWLRSLVDVHRLARQPQVWEQPLRRLETTALAVTDACLGLPDGVPLAVLADVRAVGRRPLRRALATQAAPAQRRTVPGAHTVRGVRYRFASSRSPQDLRIALAAAVLPADAVAGASARSAWRAVPQLLARRVNRWGRRIAGRPSRQAPSPS